MSVSRNGAPPTSKRGFGVVFAFSPEPGSQSSDEDRALLARF